MNLTDLHTFSLVAETGTISAAAKQLGVPKSTVSRRVRRLEDALGQQLLRRTSRAVALTDHGRVLHQRSAPSLQELQSATDAIRHADTEPSGTLRVTTVPGFGHSHQFLNLIRNYGQKYPKTTVELELSTRLVNLIEEGFDVGIRLHIGNLPGHPALISRRLLRFERGLYASPDYIERRGQPSSLADLKSHCIAAHSIVDIRESIWTFDGVPLEQPVLLPQPRWLINDAAALERLALAGAGVTLLSTLDEEERLSRGELVRVLPSYAQQQAHASLIWPASRHLAPRVRAFIDHAVETMAN